MHKLKLTLKWKFVLFQEDLISNNEIFILNENNSLEVKTINVITEQDNNIIVDNITDNESVIIEPSECKNRNRLFW